MSILKAAVFAFAVAASALAPLTASAQAPAVTAPHRVDVRAGPDGAYPIVAVLPPRAEVEIYGCLEGYGWCDVGFGIDRGWIQSGNLRYYYQSRYVPFAGVATIVGIGLTGFFFDDYWHNHYRERNWYSDRDRWHRGPPPRYWSGPGRDYRPDYGQGRGQDHRAGPDHRQNFVPNREPNRDRGRPAPQNDGSSGWSPSQGAAPVRQPPQQAQPQTQPQTQLAPVRPHGGQPGMHAPQAAMQPPAQIAVQPPQRSRGDGQHRDRKQDDNDEKKR